MVSQRIVLCFIALFGATFGQNGELLKPCNLEDLECLSKSTETFLESTSKGIAQYDIKPIDPMTVPTFAFELKEEGIAIKYLLENFVMTGMKNLKITEFNMDIKAKTVLLKTKVNVAFDGNITMEFVGPNLKFSGSFTSRGEAYVTTTYPYDIKTNDKGVEHFEVGEEKIICEAIGIPEGTSSSTQDLNVAASKDAEFKALLIKSRQYKEKISKEGFCKSVEAAYPTVIHNIRASAKIFPKTAFFKNI